MRARFLPNLFPNGLSEKNLPVKAPHLRLRTYWRKRVVSNMQTHKCYLRRPFDKFKRKGSALEGPMRANTTGSPDSPWKMAKLADGSGVFWHEAMQRSSKRYYVIQDKGLGRTIEASTQTTINLTKKAVRGSQSNQTDIGVLKELFGQ
jgi:hypothetical protein